MIRTQLALTLAILTLSAGGIAPGMQRSGLAAEPTRPNILYFYVDDMGWGSIGPNGQSQRRADGLPYVRTPNLDRLAAAGVNFTRGYACMVCSPSRSSQQTGFHQGHTYSDRNDPNNAKKAMRADDVLIGDALSAAGYVTGYWGKWGYGGSKEQIAPKIDNVQTLPTSHGYTHVLAELHHVRAHTFFQPTLWQAPAPAGAIGGLHLVPNSMTAFRGNSAYPNSPALQNHDQYPATAYCDDSYAFAALDFIRTQGQNYNASGQPFFGLLAVQIPHAPFGEVTELPEWDREYADDAKFRGLADQTKQWAAMVTRIDAHFGNLLAALQDPNNDGDTSDSVADNTLVIFQSDNGGPGGKNNIELNANGGLTGTKGAIQEGGIRVPLVMRWPNQINADSTLRAGTSCDKVVDITDLLPTFCDLAGVPVPLGIDGVSIAATLTSRDDQRRRDFVIHEAANGQSIIRGDDKLVRSTARRQPTTFRLYNLASDRTESTDIAADHPELVTELKSLLIGERVTEPKGFANTYHRWTGNDGDVTSDADHWSDYVYANAGVTYTTDSGAPALSWVATIHNDKTTPRRAIVDEDLHLLALEISGDTDQQLVKVTPGHTLTGRNEIRIGPNGVLLLDDGAAASLRWIEVARGGQLGGQGAIDATVYNHGTLDAAADQTSTAALKIVGDYHQTATGVLRLNRPATGPIVSVGGTARLAGSLDVQLKQATDWAVGEAKTVFTASKIIGRFSNASDLVVASGGQRFQIRYDAASVQLVRQ